MKLKCTKTFSMVIRGKGYGKALGEIFEADEFSAATLIKIGVAEAYAEPKPARKAKAAPVEEPEVVVADGGAKDALSED